MNSDQVEGKWKQLKGSVKEKWGKLTDDDLNVIAGKQQQLEGKIQEKYGITKEEAAKQVREWMAASRDAGTHGADTGDADTHDAEATPRRKAS
jgi:uncharacterized protein YjbJ (UPF0337 family)